MNIKLRARLSAYSKIDSLASVASYIPEPELTEAGHIVTVGSAGEYKLMSSTSPTDIDTLFEYTGDKIVSKDDIDKLFPVSSSTNKVDKEQIDSLFGDGKKPPQQTSSNTVSYAQIDSLFK
jgi:hypothetical protein